MSEYYVYLWFRPNCVPLYVGYGKWRRKRKQQRWADHITRTDNRHLTAAFKKYGTNLPIIIVRDELTVAEARETEVAFITAIGRSDLGNGPLVNQTDGGDGALNVSQEVRKRIGDAHRGTKHGPCPPERRAKISMATRGRIKSVAEREGISRGNKGRIRSTEFKTKVSAGMKRRCEEYGGQTLGKKLSPAACVNIGNGSRGQKRSDATRKLLSQIGMARMQDPTKRKHLSERIAAAWADPEVRVSKLRPYAQAKLRNKKIVKMMTPWPSAGTQTGTRGVAATRAKRTLIYVRDEDMTVDPPRKGG